MLEIADPQSQSVEPLDEDTIVDRIFEAVIEQRLPPGTKLSESALCRAFGVGRMRIRRCLLLLASRDIVELQSNRGAYVSRPSAEQAREVFEARRAIEPNVASIAVERATAEDIDALRSHIESEQMAHRDGDRRRAIRLSGQFHVRLAETARNHVMERMVKELVTRTSLIIGIYGAPGTSNCHEDEHDQILHALVAADSVAAGRIMKAHLVRIEREVDLNAPAGSEIDLVSLFRND